MSVVGINKAELNGHWAGDSVGYAGVHHRLRNWRGRPENHQCADCGSTAQQWSYDGGDPNERRERRGPYSTDLALYSPRCIRCHKARDGGCFGGGEHHPNHKLTDAQCREIAAAFAAGEVRGAIAARYGIARRTVYKVAMRGLL